MTFNLRPRQPFDYRLLNSGENISLESSIIIIRPVLDEPFFVERWIWKRKDQERSGYEYLVEWRDYRLEDCTWEPECHIPESMIANFVPNEVSTERLRHFSYLFERAIKSRLKSRNPKCVIPVEYDIFRHVFGTECSILCEFDDFHKLDLTDHWFFELNKDGIGRKIKFPIRSSVRFCQRKIYVKSDGKLVLKEVVLERCTVYSSTEACDISDL